MKQTMGLIQNILTIWKRIGVGGLFVLLLLGFGLSEGIEPTEMQLTRFALVFVFGCLGGVFSILRTERHRH